MLKSLPCILPPFPSLLSKLCSSSPAAEQHRRRAERARARFCRHVASLRSFLECPWGDQGPISLEIFKKETFNSAQHTHTQL